MPDYVASGLCLCCFTSDPLTSQHIFVTLVTSTSPTCRVREAPDVDVRARSRIPRRPVGAPRARRHPRGPRGGTRTRRPPVRGGAAPGGGTDRTPGGGSRGREGGVPGGGRAR